MLHWGGFHFALRDDLVSRAKPESRATFRAEWIGWAIVCLAAVFHIIAVLGASLRDGRLAVAPTYDDVAYLVEGLTHVGAFESGGFRKLLVSFAQVPPHAPLNTFLAVLGLALTPGHRYGVYLMDGLWVILVLALTALLLRPYPRLTVIGLLLALLAVPSMGIVVSEFRPDMSWGLLTGVVSLLLITSDLPRLSTAKALLFGAMIGLDILSKPTGFMPVLVSLGIAYVVSLAACWTEARFTVRKVARPTLLLFFGAAVIAVPFFWVAWQELLKYIRDVLINDRDIWTFEKRALGEELVYFFHQSRAAFGWLTPIAPLLVVAWVLRLAVAKPISLPAIVRAIGVLLLLIADYAVPTISPVKTFFFGYIYYGAVIAASLWALAALAQSFRLRPVLVAIAGLTVFAVCWTPRSDMFRATDPNVVAADLADQAIAPAVVKVLAAQDRSQQPPLVMDLSPGPVYMHGLQYHALLADAPGVFSMIWAAPSFERVMQTVNTADVNVISERGAIGQSPANFPIYDYLDQIIKALQGDPNWRTIASYTDKSGFHTYAFARTTMASAAGF